MTKFISFSDTNNGVSRDSSPLSPFLTPSIHINHDLTFKAACSSSIKDMQLEFIFAMETQVVKIDPTYKRLSSDTETNLQEEKVASFSHTASNSKAFLFIWKTNLVEHKEEGQKENEKTCEGISKHNL
ncbi:hypothetical protein Rs2_17357 [Raphanus sativus]|nr:hypothetical protein Rs2_17357 [Raphanus sativus]